MTLLRSVSNDRIVKPNDSPFQLKKTNASNVRIPGDVRGGRTFDPLCVMMYGRRGAGKTATMTALGLWFQQQYEKTGTRAYIAANYHVDFARYCSPYLLDELSEFPEWGKDAVVLVDEISAYAASERSTSRSTVDLGILLTQVRKRNIEMIFCTQFPQEISRRVLRQVDLFIEVEQTADHKQSFLYVHDYWGQFTNDISRKPWPPMRYESDWTLQMPNIDLIWNRYDTKEVVAPAWSDAREDIISENWSDVLTANEPDPEEDEPSELTLEEYLASQMSYDRHNNAYYFDVGRHFNEAKKRDHNFKNRQDFATWLMTQGWEIQTMEKGRLFAVKPST
jgi:hypothetical protein